MSSYVSPVPKGTQKMRSDQGQDYKGQPGQSVVAIGHAHVDAVKDDPNGFGKVVYYTLLDGPSKGQQIYVGHALPVVYAGQVIEAGKPVARLLQSPLGNAKQPGWTEVGLAKDGVPEFGVHDDGGSKLAALLKGAREQAGYGVSAVATSPAASAAVAPTDTSVPDPTFTAPPPTASPAPGPDVQMPGSVNYQTNDLAALWDQLASQNFASPETRQFAQNASILGG